MESPSLWYIHGKAYDLSAFLREHPGGAILGLGRGWECTALFESYHLSDPAHADAMLSTQIARDPPSLVPCPYSFENDGFYRVVRQRVRQYFAESGISTKAPLAAKVAIFVSLAAVALLIVPAFVFGSVIAAIAHGLLRAFCAMAAAHPASHRAVFRTPRANRLFARLATPLLLSCEVIWMRSHVASHHVDTLKIDDLQDNYPIKRVQGRQRLRAWHRFQHLYAWPLYLVGVPVWLVSDWVDASRFLLGLRPPPTFEGVSRREGWEAWAVLSADAFLTIALPFLCLPLGRAALVFLASNALTSLNVVLSIMVNHEVIQTSAEGEPVKDKARRDWGEHQVRTSHNFSVDNRWMLYWVGGVNMMIEHHLFPSVYHTHYPRIAPIVRETAREYGLPYHTSPGVLGALASHYRLLRSRTRDLPATSPA
jgi:linoleoyl-CoA desaturase